ncbi:MAG TPA: TIGR00730 family Rossman fold protein [Candidatus Udaeobacter sp.]|nr:TIGR00730 family Rossman fold protein [Candidatus Udaeobacter sp.]
MEEDFTGGAIHDQPTRRQWSVEPPFDARVRQLVRDWDASESPELIEEMIVTALKIARDHMTVADLKLINRSMKEMRNAARVFAPFQNLRKVAVFGSARTSADSPVYEVAKDFAHQMVLHNFMVVTGGGDGIMGAAQRGAGRAHSFGLNIRLPSEQRANEIIHGDPKLITLNYFFTRKLNFVKEAHAFALFPGGFGTLDETFEVLTLMQTGKARIIPVVMLNRPGGNYWELWMKFITDRLLKRGLISQEDFSFFKITRTIPEAVEEILHFYKIYHSARWVGERFVIRINDRLSKKAITNLNQQFADILRVGEIVQRSALSQEKNEPEILHLPRLILIPFRNNFGRFRQLIDAINSSSTV